MDVGTEWLIDAFGCRGDRLADAGFLREVCDAVVAELDLHVVGQPQWRQFPPPGGVTALFLLTESHLALHTYPEKGVATINLYCCRPRRDWDWRGRLAQLLGAKHVMVRVIERGADAERCAEANWWDSQTRPTLHEAAVHDSSQPPETLEAAP